MKQITLMAGTALALLLSSGSTALAQGGNIISRPCPYNCKDAGISKDHCRDWREGGTCYVEDTSQEPRGRLRSEEDLQDRDDALLRDRSIEMERMRDAERRRRAQDALERYQDYESDLDRGR